MSTTSKSPRKVLEVAYLVGSCTLSRYSHECSPKKFTQPQLFACLVLKEFLRLDYRKLTALLADARDLCAVIELDPVPHYTTFQKAAERLLISSEAQRLLRGTIKLAKATGRLPRRVSLAAGDGTGLESRHVSHYYVRRRANGTKYWHNTTYATFPKAGVLCDTDSHFILSVVPMRGPSPDILHARKLLERGLAATPIDTVALDAGYDAEHLHEFARDKHGVRTLIPAKIGRPTAKRPNGRWRRQMAARLHTTRYTQRWQVETVHSMLKRLLGSSLRARTYWSQCRETTLRAITHNVMILKRTQVFYGAVMSPFRPRDASSRLAGRIAMRYTDAHHNSFAEIFEKSRLCDISR